MNSQLPDNEILGKLTIEQRIELGNSYVEETKELEAVKIYIDQQIRQRQDLSTEEKKQLINQLMRQSTFAIKSHYDKIRTIFYK